MKKFIALLLVFLFAGSVSATVVGEWNFDNPANRLLNTGAAGTGSSVPQGDGTLTGNTSVNQGALINSEAPSTGMNVGGGATWGQVSVDNNYNALNLMIGDFWVDFYIARDDNYNGWNEPISKYNSTAARSDWIMEMVGPTNACEVMWKSAYDPGNVGYYASATVDLSGGYHFIRGHRIVGSVNFVL